MVVGRGDFHHVHTDHRYLVADTPHRVEQLPRGEPARLGSPGARGVPRVGHVNVHRQKHPVAVIGGDRHRLGEHIVEPAGDDLGHLVGTHALLGHPRQCLRPRPIAAQPDLQEPVPTRGTALDQPAHGLAVTDQRAEFDVASIGVGIEVDHRHPTPTDRPSDSGDVGPGDRVIPTQNQRHCPRAGDPGDDFLQRRARFHRITGEHLHIPGIAHVQVQQAIRAHRQRGSRAVHGQVTGLPQRLRPETRPGTGGRAAVERCADDHHLGVGIGGRIGLVALGHPEEGQIRTELCAVTCHSRPSFRVRN